MMPIFGSSLQPGERAGIVILTHESPFDTEAVDWDVETIDSVQYGKAPVMHSREIKESGELEKYTPENPAGFFMLVEV
jgi:hypothetical protein